MINNYYLKIIFIINIFFLILFFENAHSSNKVVILVKIDKEIVTNNKGIFFSNILFIIKIKIQIF